MTFFAFFHKTEPHKNLCLCKTEVSFLSFANALFGVYNVAGK